MRKRLRLRQRRAAPAEPAATAAAADADAYAADADAGAGRQRHHGFHHGPRFTYNEDGAESSSDDEQEAGGEVQPEVAFQPRALPVKTFDRDGFMVYALFLALFIMSTIGDRSNEQYYFAAAVKTAFSEPDFMQIAEPGEYYEWLAMKFLPKMAELSVANAPDAAFAIVGAPRIKQVRGANCTTPEYMAHVVPNCYDNVDDRTSYGGADGLTFIWSDSDELRHWSSEMGQWYSSAGFLVPDDMMQAFLMEPQLVDVHGTELFQYPHESVDISALEDAGFWDAKTRAVFHDFTIYSSSMDAFMVVRLTCEIGLQHGTILVSHDMRFLRLRELIGAEQFLEYAFVAMLALLIGYDINHFKDCYMRPGQLMTERIIQLRYELRYKQLHHGAFQKINEYLLRGICIHNLHVIIGLHYVPI